MAKTYIGTLAQGGIPAKLGVYPVTGFGSCVIASNTTLQTTDAIQLAPLPANGYLDDFTIALPALDGGSGLTLSLQDTTGTPMVYISSTTKGQAAGVLTWGDYYVTSSGLGLLYTAQSMLQLVPAHVATNTTGASALTILYRVKFSPA